MQLRITEPSRFAIAAAVLVHLYTAAGAILAFIGVRAVLHDNYRLAFATMLAATTIDSTDGLFARILRVKQVLPAIDGGRIDDIVDYITFVFLPMLLIDRFGGLPPGAALPVVAIVLLCSALGFAAADAKTTDHFFTGFPSYWNIVVFYLYLFHTSPFVNALVLVLLSAMIFVRVKYVYPSRTPYLRPLTMVLSWGWGIAVVVLVWRLPAPPLWLAILSLAFPVYYIVVSLILHARGRQVRSM